MNSIKFRLIVSLFLYKLSSSQIILGVALYHSLAQNASQKFHDFNKSVNAVPPLIEILKVRKITNFLN